MLALFILAADPTQDLTGTGLLQFGILGLVFAMVIFRKGLCLTREVDDRDKTIAAKDAELQADKILIGKYQEKWEQAIPLLARAVEVIEREADRPTSRPRKR